MVNQQRLWFFLDESSFSLAPEAIDRIPSLVERLIELILRCREDGNQVGRWSGLEFTHVIPGLTLCDLMYDTAAGAHLDRETRLALQQTVRRCLEWDEEVPTGSIMDQPSVVNPTITFVHHQLTMDKAASCLCLPTEDGGSRQISLGGHTQAIWFIHKAENLLAFYRQVPEIENFSEERYIEHGVSAFPSLYFKPGIAKEFRRFTRPFSDIRQRVTSVLAVLNDSFQEIFCRHQFQPEPTCAELEARYGLSASPESPKTRKNKAAMREREMMMVGGTTLYCKWHCKLEPTANRIHFHPGTSTVADGRVLIWIFAEHLIT